MVNFKNFSIKTKGAIFMIASMLAVSALVAALVLYLETSRIRESKVAASIGIAKVVAENLKAPLAFEDAKAASDILDSVRTDPTIGIAQVFDESNRLFASVVGRGDFVGDPGVVGDLGVEFSNDEAGRDRLIIQEPVVLDGKKIGRVSLVIDTGEILRRQSQVVPIVIAIALLASISASTLLYFFQGKLLSPIIRLAKAARKISETKDYALRVEASTTDEVGSLVGAFNQMLTEIQRRDMELIGANEGLEANVAERTRALEDEILRRKRYEDALHREREMLRGIVNNAPVAMAMLDNGMLYLAHSARWLADYNLSGEIIGRAHYDLAGGVVEAMRKNYERGLKGETLSSSEDRISLPDGSFKYLRWAIQPWFNADGVQGGIIVVSQPVDDLVEARENAILSAERMRRFFANISHEIRTPLNGILGFAELLRATPLTAEQMEKLSTVQSSGEMLLSLINDILDFAKLDSRKMTLERRTFSLRAMIEAVVGLLNPLYEKKGIVLRISIDSDLPKFVVGDEVRLRQILINLLGNALKFTEKGEVSLEAANHRSDSTAVNLRFRISDTGIGIPRENLALIFEPFTQGDGSITRRFGGSGLGLSICKELVELMSGRMQVQSQPGLGSTFTFWISLAPAVNVAELPAIRQVEPAPQTGALSVKHGCRVLVAEDNPVNQRLIAALLKSRGLEAAVVSSGHEVVKESSESAYDLILMDIQMPGMGGIDAARRIRSDGACPNRRTPIIALTAHAFEEDRRACLDSGMDDFLTKPINTQELDAALGRWLPTGSRFAGNEG